MAETPTGAILRFEHPGAGRRRARSTPKGREVEPLAQHEIGVLLGDAPRRRDLLIEHLHLIQDRYHQISVAHLAALADTMRLAYAEVYARTSRSAESTIASALICSISSIVTTSNAPSAADSKRR